jgi:hypothetical protein
MEAFSALGTPELADTVFAPFIHPIVEAVSLAHSAHLPRVVILPKPPCQNLTYNATPVNSFGRTASGIWVTDCVFFLNRIAGTHF